MPTVLQCLTSCPNPYFTAIHSTTVSAKPTASTLPRLNLQIFPNASSVLFAEPLVDSSRHNRNLAALPSAVASEVHNEGDVRRVFAYLTTFVEQAFYNTPKVWHRWEAGPPGYGVTTAETIDTWWGVYIGGQQRCAAVGELKRPGVIQPEEWPKQEPKADTIKLGKEIRMYAYQYKSPQTFVFDGNHLLVIRFQASSRQNIREPACMADIFFIEKDSPNIPYWIDQLVAEGLGRLRAEIAGQLNLGGYERYFRYYDGKPYWVLGQVTYWEHPDGYIRSFNDEQWWWTLANQAPVLDTPKLE